MESLPRSLAVLLPHRQLHVPTRQPSIASRSQFFGASIPQWGEPSRRRETSRFLPFKPPLNNQVRFANRVPPATALRHIIYTINARAGLFAPGNICLDGGTRNFDCRSWNGVLKTGMQIRVTALA